MIRSTADAAMSLHCRRLGPDDLDAVEALHHLVIGPVARPEIVKPEHRDYFAGILAGRGHAVGLFDREQMVAYGILQHDHPPQDDPHRLLGLPAQVRIGRLAGASVHPDYRGRRLQRRTIAARVSMAPPDMVLFSTAAPVNTPSWSNLLAEGFFITGIDVFFGGYDRFVMVRGGPGHDRAAGIAVDPRDTVQQKALFARGWRGCERVCLPGGVPGVLFAPVAA